MKQLSYFLLFLIIILTSIITISGQSYENKRCKCVCPSVSSILNSTHPSVIDRNIYIDNLPPLECNCEQLVMQNVTTNDTIKEELRKNGFCERCECKNENRNTTIIKVVVIIVLWIISLLVIYMLFLICLDPLLNKRIKGNYQEHTNEDDDTSVPGTQPTSSHQMGVRGNVLNRVGHQQDKWKRQVIEQRRNIYDRHTMLN